MRNPARVLGPALVLALPTQLVAQDLQAICREMGKVTVGQWASYSLTGSSEGTARFAIVGTEQQDTATLYWYEMNMNISKGEGAGRGPMIMQLLVPGVDKAGNVRAMVMKAGSEPAMRLPQQMVGMMAGRAGANNVVTANARRCSGGEVVGWESVTVPAGTIRALHVKGADGDAWLATGVPFGLVKAVGTGREMVLTGRGADGKSSITETPQEMPGMPPR